MGTTRHGSASGAQQHRPLRPGHTVRHLRAAGSVQGFRVNPGVAWLVFPLSVSAAQKGLGSDEETGVRRSNGGLDRPRLHADGAPARQARGGRPPDARPLVPDANRGARPPEVAAVVPAGPEGELILERSAGAGFFSCGPGTIDKIGKLSGRPRQPATSRSSTLRVGYAHPPRHAFRDSSGPICVCSRAGMPEAACQAKATIVIIYPHCALAYCRQ